MTALTDALTSLRAQRDALNVAIEALEGTDLEPDAPVVTYRCEPCDLTFSSAQGLSLHRRRSAAHATERIHEQARQAAADGAFE